MQQKTYRKHSGGAWNYSKRFAQNTFTVAGYPYTRCSDLGFRIIRDLTNELTFRIIITPEVKKGFDRGPYFVGQWWYITLCVQLLGKNGEVLGEETCGYIQSDDGEGLTRKIKELKAKLTGENSRGESNE
jgi:hypothetical protein